MLTLSWTASSAGFTTWSPSCLNAARDSPIIVGAATGMSTTLESLCTMTTMTLVWNWIVVCLGTATMRVTVWNWLWRFLKYATIRGNPKVCEKGNVSGLKEPNYQGIIRGSLMFPYVYIYVCVGDGCHEIVINLFNKLPTIVVFCYDMIKFAHNSVVINKRFNTHLWKMIMLLNYLTCFLKVLAIWYTNLCWSHF